MVKVFEGKLTAKETDKFCIVISRFNDFIGSKLLQGALDAFIRHGVKEENIDVVWVPGAFEIPLMCKKWQKGLRRNCCSGRYYKGANTAF